MTPDAAAPFRVFLAEDNPADVYLVREAFREHGLDCDLQVVGDGEEALHHVRRIGSGPDAPAPDLVMVDLNLPRVDRGDILREFRDNPACRPIPLIVLSSSDVEQDLRAAGQLPDTSLYFRKPAELDAFLDLGAKARQLLEDRQHPARTRGDSRVPPSTPAEPTRTRGDSRVPLPTPAEPTRPRGDSRVPPPTPGAPDVPTHPPGASPAPTEID